MKNYIFAISFLFLSIVSYGQGSTCAGAVNLAAPSATPNCINPTDFSQNAAGLCTGTGGMGYSNYYYRFCTSASNPCIAFQFNVDPNAEWMAVVYNDACSALVSGSAICNTIGGGSTGGSGYWSSAGNDPGVSLLAPSTCYRIRINVTDAYASTFNFCYYTETPPEDACSGAMAIDGSPQTTDNACATEGTTDPAPAQLCAGSLENTTWYSFTVANPCGSPCNVVITTANIDCAGGGEGFQIGYFSGSCGSLTNLGCTAGSGGSVAATLSNATPGATYYVGLDGNAGANCYFDISATNTVPLPVELLYFRGLLYESRRAAVQWSTATEFNASHYDIYRSENGTDYRNVGKVYANNRGSEASEYTFDDPESLINEATYYKIVQYDINGNKVEFGPIAIASRPTLEEVTIAPNPVGDNATIYFNAAREGTATIEIRDLLGRIILSGPVEIVKGGNSIRFTTSSFENGIYFARINTGSEVTSIKFSK